MREDRERIAELIKRIQGGDISAFEELYKLTSPRAYFVALELTKNEHDAEDILQESYIKALERIDEIDPDKNFSGWFYQLVANKSKDFIKGKKLLVYDGEEEEILEAIPDENLQFSPEENLNQDELRSEVMAAIDELTAEKRACVMMMYFGEMSVNEIAESLEVPVSTVKNRLFTARRDLKTKFEKKGITALYGAAPLGVVIWALGKTSEAVSATFAASAASAEVLAGIGASGISVAAAGASSAATAGAATATAASGVASASTAAATGAGVAAKVAAFSVAQKVVAGVVTAGVISGSAAGVATVVKNNNDMPPVTTAYTEEVTTAPSQTAEFAFAVITTSEASTASASEKTTSITAKREPTATTAKPTETRARETEPTATVASTKTKKTKVSTTRRDYSLNKSTTLKITTEKQTTEASATETTTEMTTTKNKPQRKRLLRPKRQQPLSLSPPK